VKNFIQRLLKAHLVFMLAF